LTKPNESTLEKTKIITVILLFADTHFLALCIGFAVGMQNHVIMVLVLKAGA